MTEFRLVCCMPTYAEGPLAVTAARSVLGHVDELVVWEGAAGKDRVPAGTPATPLEMLGELGAYVQTGSWLADPDKRTEMLKWCKQQWHDRPLWILWLDADEILVNAAGLRDLVQYQMWEDEAYGRSLVKPDNLPTGGVNLRYVEADGSVAKEWGRLVRADVIRRYIVSNLILETVLGQELRLGRRLEFWTDEFYVRRQGVHGEAACLAFPLEGEPHFLHRSHLRHPWRSGLRLHEQEGERLAELGLPTGAK